MRNALFASSLFGLFLALSFFVMYVLRSPYVPMIMLLPVFFSSTLYGSRYGYATAFASAAAIYFFFCEPFNSFWGKDLSCHIRIVTYLTLAVISIAFIAKKRAADDALKEMVFLLELRVEEGVAARMQKELETKKELERALEITRDSEDEIQALNEELEASLKSIELERNYLQEILDEMPNIVVIKDENLRILFVNEALCKFFGKPKGELIGKTVFDLLPQEAAQGIWENERQILESSSMQALEESAMDTDGSIRALWSVKKSLMTDNGEMGLLVVLTDITEKKILENALKNSEARYRAISDGAVTGIYVVQDGMMSYVNQAYATMLGYDSADEIIGKIQVSDLIAPNERKKADELIQKRLNGEIREARYEVGLLRKDGREITVDAHGAIGMYNGRPAIIGVLIDKTAQKKIEEELKESEEKFRTVFESSQDAIMLSDEHGFFDCNKKALELFGISDKEELVSYHPADLSPAFLSSGEDSKTAAKKQIEIAVQNGSSHFEWESRRKNGEIFPSDVLLSAFEYKGRVVVQATVRDITERHEARRTSSLLRKFFDCTSEGIMVTNDKGLITVVNPAFSRITGYPAAEVRGKNPNILQSGEHTKEFYEEMWHEILENGRWEGEVHDRRKNGEVYPVWLTVTSMRNDKGDIENFVAVFLDLSALKEKQATIDEQERIIMMQSRFAAMGEMIGMIAHQWRQPITAIGMGANNMLIDIELGDMDAATFRAHLEAINTQVQFLSRTIDDFRGFFKPDNEPEEVQIGTIVEDSLRVISKSLENNNIEMVLQLEYNPVVTAYLHEMIQVLLTIINNAKDAMTEIGVKPAVITISTIENPNFPDFVELHICDNGGGVPDGIKQKIFEPYFTTKEAKNGTGLGLYIAKSIVEKHQDGSIGVENADGGACFWIRLHVYKPSIEEERQ